MQAGSDYTHTCLLPSMKAVGFSAGLQKLQTLEVLGRSDVGEEKPGLLNKILKGLTSLHMRASSLRCSDIASPNLRCLSVIKLSKFDRGSLPGADSSMHQARQQAA